MRQHERDETNSRLAEAKGEETYFIDVIEYFNAKLAFFQVVTHALDPRSIEKAKGPDYEFYMQIQPAKQELWDMLDSLYLQKEALQN